MTEGDDVRPGLCSVTFRSHTPEEVIALAADAGLSTIEWGADVHVPPGDTARGAQVGQATRDAGLAVASYGSYFRAGAAEGLTPILDTAQALGADRVRVWAGFVGSADATPAQYAQIVARLTDAVAEASDRGVTLAVEYHGGTVADGPAAVLRLLRDVPRLSTYWQPTVGAADAQALAELTAVAGHVSAVHVFSWWPRTERRRLRARADLWQRVCVTAAAMSPAPRDALLEFVPDDDPALLAAEAAALRGWLAD